MPGLVPMLSKVPVLSARSTFEPMHPDAPLKWKFYAFQEKIASCFPADGVTVGGAQKNIVSFGDSHVEREAVRAVTRYARHVMPSQIINQLTNHYIRHVMCHLCLSCCCYVYVYV